VRQATVADFRHKLSQDILAAAAGGLGGQPATPESMNWLWPLPDSDENKIIVADNPSTGQVSLFDKLNSTAGWTDALLVAGETDIRAVHFNELRQVAQYLRRGRWTLPIYFSAGLFSILPDTPWVGQAIANNGSNELRALGFALLRTDESTPRGLVNAAVRTSSQIELTCDTSCQVQVYRCLREVDYLDDPPTWNQFDPSASANWSSPGAAGAADATLVDALSMTADQAASLSGQATADAMQAMVDGAPQNLLVRRSDSGGQTIALTGRLIVEFDLNTPPN
jgi:hypothetical protein